MAFYVTRDPHGDFRDVAAFTHENDTKKSDTLIIMGGVSEKFLKKQLNELPITLLFIPDSRELPEDCKEVERFGSTVYVEKEFPNLLFARSGEIFAINGRKCLIIADTSNETRNRVERELNGLNWQVDAVLCSIPPDGWLTDIKNNLDCDKWLCNKSHVDDCDNETVCLSSEICELFKFPLSAY